MTAAVNTEVTSKHDLSEATAPGFTPFPMKVKECITRLIQEADGLEFGQAGDRLKRDELARQYKDTLGNLSRYLNDSAELSEAQAEIVHEWACGRTNFNTVLMATWINTCH